MVARIRNSPGYGVLFVVILGLMGCARSVALPPPPMTHARPVQPAPPPAMTAPLEVTPHLNVQTPEKRLWRPVAKERDWKYIVLHHTASEKASVESIHEEHLKRKDASGNPWMGIGYHFVIGNGNGMPDGDVEPTFRWKQQLQGAHAGSTDPAYNQQGIGICLVGNFENHAPTAAQIAAMRGLVRTLKTNYRVASKNVIGHRDVRATECPGKLFPMQEVANEPIDFQFSEAKPADPELTVANQTGDHP